MKPLLVRLHKQFNISVAEIDHQDTWQDALIACALVSNDAKQTQKALQKVPFWIERHWPDVDVVADRIELI